MGARTENIEVVEGRVSIDHLSSDDQVLVALMERIPPEGRADLIERVLAVGARGIVTMGVGLDLSEVDSRVRTSVELATEQARRQVDSILAEARAAVESTLDPDQRTSLLGKALDELTTWRDGFLGGVDPDRPGSHTGRLLGELRSLLGPGGELESRLATALDLDGDGSSFGRFAATVDGRLTEIRDLVAEQRGRRAEADRGTAKGFEYEDRLEDVLRAAAAGIPGALVERTSDTPGSLSGESLVGDFVVVLGDGGRIAVEAKNTRSITLTGRQGILDELDRAMANREADAAICISAQEAFPREVGPFGVYGRRLLAVDDGDGTMTWVAVRWAAALVQAARAGDRLDQVDATAVHDTAQRIRRLGQVLSTSKRSLGEANSSIERVREGLDELRRDLLTLVDELELRLGLGGREPDVVGLRLEAG